MPITLYRLKIAVICLGLIFLGAPSVQAESKAQLPLNSQGYVHVSPETMISWVEKEISLRKPIQPLGVAVSESEILHHYSLGLKHYDTEITFANCDFGHELGVECRNVILVVDTGLCNSFSKSGPRRFVGVPFGFAYHHSPSLERCHMALYGYLTAEGPLIFFDGLDWFLEAVDRVRSGQDVTKIPSTVYLRPDKTRTQRQFDLFRETADRYLKYLPVPSDLIPIGKHYHQASDKRLQLIERLELGLMDIPGSPHNLTGKINLPKSGTLYVEHSTFCGRLAILGDQCSIFRLTKNLEGLDRLPPSKHRLDDFPFIFETHVDFYTSIPSLRVSSEFTLNNKGISLALLTEILTIFDAYFKELQTQ